MVDVLKVSIFALYLFKTHPFAAHAISLGMHRHKSTFANSARKPIAILQYLAWSRTRCVWFTIYQAAASSVGLSQSSVALTAGVVDHTSPPESPVAPLIAELLVSGTAAG